MLMRSCRGAASARRAFSYAPCKSANHWVFAVILVGIPADLFVVATAYAQDKCTSIRFAPGQTSTTVKGVSPPNEAVCYTFAAAAGQTANLKVTGRNMVISVIDVGDARDVWTFTTKAQTYKFVVGQLMRSITSEPYTVTLSVK
jgi:hypothetical protein